MTVILEIIRKNPVATGLAVALCAVLVAGGLYIRTLTRPDVFDELSAVGDVSVAEGELISVKVLATQVEDLYGYQFKLRYDHDVLEYQGLESSIQEIGTIFHKGFDEYILVGATRVGEEPGVTADNTPVCEILFSAKSEEADLALVLSEVSVVTSGLDYLEDLPDWGIVINKK